MGKEVCRVYDMLSKGIFWGWEVFGYIWIKVIFLGVFLVFFLVLIFGWVFVELELQWWSVGLGIMFFVVIGILLVMDLD